MCYPNRGLAAAKPQAVMFSNKAIIRPLEDEVNQVSDVMDPVRFGLIGYGAWGVHHAQAIANTEGAVLKAIAVRSKQSQEAAQAAHLQTKVYGDYGDMLARDELAVVDVVLPSHLHHEVATAVLESGRHLLLEK